MDDEDAVMDDTVIERQVIAFDEWPSSSSESSSSTHNNTINSASYQKAQDGWYLLKNCFDEADLGKALQLLYDCCNDEMALNFLEDNHIQKLILDKFKFFKSYEKLFESGCLLLYRLCFYSNTLRQRIINLDSAKICVKLLNQQPITDSAQVIALKLISYLTTSDEVKKFLLSQGQNVMSSIRISMGVYVVNAELQCISCNVLHILLKRDQSRQQIFIENGDLKAVIIALKTHINNASVLKEASSLLTILIKHDGVRSHLVENQIHCIIVESRPIKRVSATEEVWSACMLLISKLCSDDVVVDYVIEKDIQSNILTRLMLCPKDRDVQTAGFKTFYAIAHAMFEDVEYPQEYDDQWLKLIWVAIKTYLEDSAVQSICMKALAKLMEYRPVLESRIGEDPDLKQDPIHTMCCGAIFVHWKNAKVFSNACTAIYWICADNERLQDLMMEKNIHLAILLGMKEHWKSRTAQAAGCMAIRGLTIFSQKWKSEMAKHEPLNSLIRALIEFPKTEEVQFQAVAAIACLADNEVIRHQCLVEKVHHKVLTAMQVHDRSELMQECALEAMAILASAEGGTKLMIDAEAIEQVIQTMEIHQFSAGIQKRAMVVLQIFSEEWQFHDEQLLLSLASVLQSVLDVFFDDIFLLKETCVAIHLLAEEGSDICHAFIDRKVERGLFNILEQKQDYADLLEYASYCIYIIGWVAGFNPRLLLSACELGLLKVVECLIELGVDCNQGEGQDTPICYACRHQNEAMVQCLLQQGINDVQTALKLSLDLEAHNITGMLLHHMGFDKEAGIVSWSGLNLGNIQPEWLIATLLDSPDRVSKPTEDDQLKPLMQQTRARQQARSCLNLSVESQVLMGSRLALRYPVDIDLRENEDISKQLTTCPDTVYRQNVERRSFLSKLRLKRQSSPDVCKINPFDFNSAQPNSPLLRKRYSENDIFKDYRPTRKQFVFVDWPQEIETWKQQTVSGANTPFSNKDPRRKQAAVGDKVIPVESSWLRKSPTPFSRNKRKSLSRRSAIYEISNHYGSTDSLIDRKFSLPENIEVVYEEDSDRTDGTDGTDGVDGVLFEETEHELCEIERAQTDPDQDTSLEDEPSSYKRHQPFDRNRRRYRSNLDHIPNENIVKKPVKHQVNLFDVSSNNIRDLSSIVVIGSTLSSMFESIEKLVLSRNCLLSLPESIFKCLPLLQHLDVSHNELQVFPTQCLSCQKIKILDLSHNQLQSYYMDNSMPVSFSLTELYLSYNKLDSYPTWLNEKLPHLTTLYLNSNKISELPEENKLKKLVTLSLSHNYLNHIPEEYLIVKYLETFECSGNELVSLPSEKQASLLIRLNCVKLANNSLHVKEPYFIPKFILELPSLRALDISGNGLVGFPPPVLWQTNNLRELLLSNNNIDKLNLGLDVKRWTTLERLVIQKNDLSELPKEIGQLSGLTSLDISHNTAITTLPDELGKLSKLWELSFDNLRLDIDEALLRGRTRDLIGFLHEKLKNSEEYYRIKMMVVGFGGRGKTTLLRTLQRPKKSAHRNEKSVATVGILVKDWRFLTARPVRDGRDRDSRPVTYTLSTWDFAGQEEFYSTHQCFLSNRALYLVVYDLSRGLSEVETLKPWLVNIHARAPGCPVIIVGTHKDAIPPEDLENCIYEMRCAILRLTSKPGFPEIKDMVIVNATKDTREINELEQKIRKVINEFKLKGKFVMGQKIPVSYKQLEELITEQAKIRSFPVLRQHELNRLIKGAKIELDHDELQQAVRFLHEVGVLLHFEDSTLYLKDLYFINPEWLCRMFAQVVTVREINPFISEQGILLRSNVPQLFTGKKVGRDVNYSFPKDMIGQYLRLLEKFEIALPLNDRELLIPCRVSPKRPQLNLPGKARTDYIHRHYEMPFVPIGFWSRLICRFLSFMKEMMPEMISGVQDTKYWQQGIYLYKSDDNFVLVEFNHEDAIVITVPASKRGGVLLGHIVDHMDALIEEWYPGLLVKDPFTGEEILQRKIPCSFCEPEDVHFFSLEELINQSDFDDVISCPNHDIPVSLRILTPDVMLWDLDRRFLLEEDYFTFLPNNESRIGEGSFGSVYRATYKDRSVAVKVFNKVGDVSPHTMMRQEVTILRRLQHPSLIEMLAVGLRPRVILLELAPLGSLGGLLKTGRALSRRLMHRIATQVSEGLMYLQKYKIIYRDMKPDNVLIFSLSLNVVVNAKITDYGIARFAASYGFYASEGTAGYKAPEVAREETYTYQADVYSLGITLYTLVTGGHHPFEELICRAELDAAVLEQRPINPITSKGQEPWPDMEDVIDTCLKEDPDKRLTAAEVYDCLNCAEVVSLKRVMYVSKDLAVECIAVRRHEDQLVEAWFGSGERGHSQLSWVNLTDSKSEIKGMILPKPQRHGRIWCMCTVRQTAVLVGVQANEVGHIIVYDAWEHQLRHTMDALPDAVISLLHYTSHDARDLILAGLANGYLAVYDTATLLTSATIEPYYIQLLPGNSTPVRCLLYHNGLIYASCGSHVVVFEELTSQSYDIKHMWDTDQNLPNLITCMVMGHDLYIGKMHSSVVEVWSVQSLQKLKIKRSSVIDIQEIVRFNSKNLKNIQTATQVSTLMLQDFTSLWIGTRGGHIVLINPATHHCIGIIHRHTSSIRSIVQVKTTGSRIEMPARKLNLKSSKDLFYRRMNSLESVPTISSVILVSGMGYHGAIDSTRTGTDFSNYGCVTVWDPELKSYINSLNEEMRKRRTLVWQTHFNSTEQLAANVPELKENTFHMSL
ncbi:leucine-rich repeat serine/threonine-protein kinase 2-like [Tubulanus polymorphus]|uniref:leucine-rich repeat serine/threonine-protein kinase 2-like n=1 Tax=Tubulanus polymorphus TaxID=672921 RepID=UPI003DA1CCF9